MREEFVEEVIDRYDELLMEEQGRGISYGEIAYIDSLDKEELNKLYEEICEWDKNNKGDD